MFSFFLFLNKIESGLVFFQKVHLTDMKLILVIFLSTTNVFHFSTTIKNPIIVSKIPLQKSKPNEITYFKKQ